MVMLESGFTWLPSYLWRLHKFLARCIGWKRRGWIGADGNCARQHPVFIAAIDAPPDPATLQPAV